jgi:spermidine synthase
MSAVRLGALSLVLAACGLTYEFVLAQTLSVLLGNSVVQYSVTIGLFLAGMGVGSMVSDKIKNQDALPWLFRLQLMISTLVPLGFMGIWLAGIHLRFPLLHLGAYGLIFSVGLLTGAELPLLMRLSPVTSRSFILALDYAGMLLACLAFPLLLLPVFGVFAALLFTSLVNAIVMLSLLQFAKSKLRFAAAMVPLLLIAVVSFERGIREWLSLQLINTFS